MKFQLLTPLTVLLTLNAGLLSASHASQGQGLPLATPAQSTPDAVTKSDPLGADISVLTPITPKPIAPKPIAQLYAHKQAGRQAVTVYVKDIPVVTFLEIPSRGSASGFKVASTAKQTGQIPGNPLIARVSQDPILRATTLTTQLNQLHAEGFDPKLIRVRWRPESRSYEINADKDLILVLGDQAISPISTGNRTQDALKITNLLRRQMGNAPALTNIIGKPLPQPGSVRVATGPVRFQISGEASWYGPGFHGARTANGESFNQYGLTAAHRNLPFGTQVRVTNLNNGRSVLVRINDRGPFVGGRVIDLSQGAASVIGVTNTGVAPVRIDVLP
jgi:rare lipoprotein A